MSWTRQHIDELALLQLRTQRLIRAAGTDAPGAEWLEEVHHCLVAAQGHALIQVEFYERAANATRLANPDTTEAIR